MHKNIFHLKHDNLVGKRWNVRHGTEYVYYVCAQALVCFMGAGSVVSHCFDQPIE